MQNNPFLLQIYMQFVISFVSPDYEIKIAPPFYWGKSYSEKSEASTQVMVLKIYNFL